MCEGFWFTYKNAKVETCFFVILKITLVNFTLHFGDAGCSELILKITLVIFEGLQGWDRPKGKVEKSA